MRVTESETASFGPWESRRPSASGCPGGRELSIDVDAVYRPADSGDLATDLAGLFVELGEVARDHESGVVGLEHAPSRPSRAHRQGSE